jgi:hypothetical protein
MGQQKTTPLLPFSRETVMYRAFQDGRCFPNYSLTPPVIVFQHIGYFTEKGRCKGGVCPTTPVPSALCTSAFEAHDGRRGVVRFIRHVHQIL